VKLQTSICVRLRDNGSWSVVETASPRSATPCRKHFPERHRCPLKLWLLAERSAGPSAPLGDFIDFSGEVTKLNEFVQLFLSVHPI